MCVCKSGSYTTLSDDRQLLGFTAAQNHLHGTCRMTDRKILQEIQRPEERGKLVEAASRGSHSEATNISLVMLYNIYIG